MTINSSAEKSAAHTFFAQVSQNLSKACDDMAECHRNLRAQQIDAYELQSKAKQQMDETTKSLNETQVLRASLESICSEQARVAEGVQKLQSSLK